MELQTSKPSIQNVIKCVLIDLSGTIHIDDTEVPGSRDSLKKLRKSVQHIRFVTNTTKESKPVLHQRLVEMGFEIKLEEIFTSLTAACDLIQKKQVRPFLLVDDKALEDFKGIPVNNPNAVLVGLAPEKFDYNHMNTAFRLVLDGAPLIAIHKGRYYQRKDGLALGPGPFVTALEYATGQKAEVVGKPEASFFMSAIRDFGCDASECIMIGDDARDDVGGAQNCGMRGILVKTGKYRQGEEMKIDPPPFQVVDDFKSAVDVILSLI